MDRKRNEATLEGLIPPPAEQLTPKLAAKWLDDWASDYARVVMFGFERKDRATRGAYGMLAADLSYLLDACGHAVRTGRTVRLEVHEDVGHPHGVCRHLARICATRPTHSYGPFTDVYDALAERIAVLLGEDATRRAREAA